MYVHVAIILVVLVVARVYVHVSSPFWSKQPVYHTYDIRFWLERGRVIDAGDAMLNRYVRVADVHVCPAEQLSPDEQHAVTELIRDHYLRSRVVSYIPEPANIFDYLSRKECFVARYTENSKLAGVLTSRRLDGKLPGTANIRIGYVDNLTVDQSYRKQGIAPTLIQTYTYSSRPLAPETLVHLFKREGPTRTSQVPLYTFDAAVYDADHFPRARSLSSDPLSAQLIEKKEYSELRAFCDGEIAESPVSVCMQYSDLFFLVGKGHVCVVVCRNKDTIEHFFLVRNTPTYDERGRPALELFALASRHDTCAYRYLPLVMQCLRGVHKDFSLVVERTGKLDAFANRINVVPLAKCAMAFFLYNYVCQSVTADKCFLVY